MNQDLITHVMFSYDFDLTSNNLIVSIHRPKKAVYCSKDQQLIIGYITRDLVEQLGNNLINLNDI